ncbi:uncharacterized protein LOC119610407 [Lucilia sericata]|uniref:uncharacterized protein LOC119610407 n=1 Tax=Lucilia sericata TaxID=13632 RepID=UPI0018A7F590|nr:uncharacterized protein LOC119610407 [Lucilia sericata]
MSKKVIKNKIRRSNKFFCTYKKKMFKKVIKKRKTSKKKILKPAIETKISASGMTEENLELMGLKIKILTVDCGKHEKWRVFNKIPNYVYYVNNLNYEIVKAHNIYERLSMSTFEHYSSIIIFINCQKARCRRKSLCTIIKAIQSNKRIRNQLKLIWASYRGYSHAFTPDILFDSMFEDFFIFKSMELDNTTLFQDHFERGIQVLLHLLTSTPFTTAQEIQKVLKCQYLLIQLKSTASLYFYGVNPALAIIINNYYFTNTELELDTREGSENDVLDLIRTFIETRTPFIVINDISKDQFLRWKDYLCRKDMTYLKNLYFITMTHGSSNNIIYTNDGEINFIEDILLPIQANATLKKTNVTFLNVHCRGDVFAVNADDDDFDIECTKIKDLKCNMSIMFSVPDSMISVRYPTKGTPVINSFTRIFCNLDSTSNVKILHDKIWDLVKKDPYYKYLDIYSVSTELVMGDCPHDDGGGNEKEYNIKPIPTNPKQILPLFTSIKNDCPNTDLICSPEKLHDTSNQECLTQTLSEDASSTLLDFKSFCLYANVNGNVFGEKLGQLKKNTNESDDEWADQWDDDSDNESYMDKKNKRKEAEIEFRKLILPFMGSTILQDENIFALDDINREDEGNRDDFSTAILDYRTLIKALDYELGISVEHY